METTLRLIALLAGEQGATRGELAAALDLTTRAIDARLAQLRELGAPLWYAYGEFTSGRAGRGAPEKRWRLDREAGWLLSDGTEIWPIPRLTVAVIWGPMALETGAMPAPWRTWSRNIPERMAIVCAPEGAPVAALSRFAATDDGAGGARALDRSVREDRAIAMSCSRQGLPGVLSPWRVPLGADLAAIMEDGPPRQRLYWEPEE